MAEYFKEPQNPLKKIDETTGDVTYVYPMTTAKQVIMDDDGTRLNTILTENILYLGDAEDSSAEVINADTLVGKIQTLFSDKEKTTPVFPRTKVSAVSDDDGVGLDVLLSEMESDTATAQSTADSAKTTATAAMPKSGGTFTGATTFNATPIIHQTTTIADNTPARLNFKVTQSDNSITSNGYIAVYDDHDTSSYGTTMVIQSYGNMVIGAGESSGTYYTQNLVGSNSENMYVTSDSAINLVTNCNTIANAKTVTVNTDGTITTTGANRSAAHVRNSEVRTTSATGTLQSTGKIIYVRK